MRQPPGAFWLLSSRDDLKQVVFDSQAVIDTFGNFEGINGYGSPRVWRFDRTATGVYTFTQVQVVRTEEHLEDVPDGATA